MKNSGSAGEINEATSADGLANAALSYKSCYCEENIWQLCGNPLVAEYHQKVVWISSLSGICPLWHQRAGADAQTPVWWDYHVILLVETDSWKVWDFDTTLARPLPAVDYFDNTFKKSSPVQPLFRVMDGAYYRRHFSSDRSHMQNSDGQWLAEPPEWPKIWSGRDTFAQMLDFSENTHGAIVSLETLLCEECVPGTVRK